MNITRLDGRSTTLENLPSVVNAMPFLTSRRLVVLTNPLAKLEKDEARKRFLEILNNLPPTTALVLVVDHLLTEERDRKKGKQHWLEKWAADAGGRAYVQACPVKKGPAFVDWIEKKAKEVGGKIEPEAAQHLAALVGDDPRQAEQEINKLLAFGNYQRPILMEDVQALTADSAEGDVFQLVDLIGNRNSRGAFAMLHRLLEEQEPLMLLGMIVRQYRLLIQVREGLDGGLGPDLARQMRQSPWLVERLIPQARRFSMEDLEAIYRHLLAVDEAMKSSMDPIIALDTLVATLTNPE
jgi:DNA polymerase-3 subunit delta